VRKQALEIDSAPSRSPIGRARRIRARADVKSAGAMQAQVCTRYTILTALDFPARGLQPLIHVAKPADDRVKPPRLVNIGIQRHTSTTMRAPSAAAAAFWLFSIAVSAVWAQECTNYGSASGSTCLCPPGLNPTGVSPQTCNLPVCGGNLYVPAGAAPGGQGGFGNVSSGCACTSGWTGPGCTGE
jgi:hypothetical protein